MGGKTTKLFRNSTQPGSKAQDESDSQYHEHLNNYDKQQQDEIINKNSICQKSPFVYHRRGSMYIDEDGDVAHEFYVETKEGSKVTLKRISNQHLTPQGDIPLDVPCLRNDYPVVLLDQSRVKE